MAKSEGGMSWQESLLIVGAFILMMIGGGLAIVGKDIPLNLAGLVGSVVIAAFGKAIKESLMRKEKQ